MKKLFLILMMFLIVGCGNKIDIEKLMSENEYVIMDVRTEEEYNELHLVDSINIPYNEIDAILDIDKDKIIFVYCRTGNRSKVAYDKLVSLGYEVYDLGSIYSIDLLKE